MIELTLPLPPAPNDMGSVHAMGAAKKKNEYRRKCWATAIGQHRPFRDPPSPVVMTAEFVLRGTMDQADNLPYRLKWVLDALKQEQKGKLYWRQGVAGRCGYFTDDDPEHLDVASVRQRKVERDEDPHLRLTLWWADDAR